MSISRSWCIASSASDVAGGVVEQGVDAHGLLVAVVDDQRRTVADVAVPEGPGPLGLPAHERGHVR